MASMPVEVLRMRERVRSVVSVLVMRVEMREERVEGAMLTGELVGGESLMLVCSSGVRDAIDAERSQFRGDFTSALGVSTNSSP